MTTEGTCLQIQLLPRIEKPGKFYVMENARIVTFTKKVGYLSSNVVGLLHVYGSIQCTASYDFTCDAAFHFAIPLYAASLSRRLVSFFLLIIIIIIINIIIVSSPFIVHPF